MEMLMDEQTEAAAKALDALNKIAGDAYDRTGGDVFGTEPPVEPPAEPTLAEALAPTSEEPPKTEPTSEPVPLILGKWKTTEEAERGYHEAVRMGNEAKARADAAEQALAATRKIVSPETTSVTEDPLDQIENYGVPKELIAKAIEDRVRKAIPEYFAPALAISQADKQIVEKYPDYAEKFSEIEQFAQSDPMVWSEIGELNGKGNFLAARQIAYLNWKVASTVQAVETETKAKAERTVEAKNARVDAGVGTSRRADSRTASTSTEPSQEEEDRLLKLYKAGHPAPYLRAKLDSMLGPEFDKATALLG
jgi:hypothetical protein